MPVLNQEILINPELSHACIACQAASFLATGGFVILFHKIP